MSAAGPVRRARWRHCILGTVLVLLVATGLVAIQSVAPGRATAASAPAAAGGPPAGTVTTYKGGCPSTPHAITAGPDGAMWFTNYEGDSIGRAAPGGGITYFTDPGIDGPDAITSGPDGALWFANSYHNNIGRITPAGSITFLGATGMNGVSGLAFGPDGALWFTGSDSAGSIGRITTAGAFTSYPAPDVSWGNITPGPDGAMWFTSGNTHRVGRITMAGQITTFTNPAMDAPGEIVAGADGALWFTDWSNTGPPYGSIGRITTAGVMSTFTSAAVDHPIGIAAGPDGALWFVNNYGHTIARITTAGAITTMGSTGAAGPYGIAPGPDGSMWFTNSYGNTIGQITMAGAVTIGVGPCVSGPRAITKGSDGAFWVADAGPSRITRITEAGQIYTFFDDAIGSPIAITGGSDGALWYTDSGGAIGRITTAGSVSKFPGAFSGNGETIGMTTGPDGAVWFTDRGTNSIKRITTAGVTSTFTDAKITSPNGIVSGPDGALWFTNTLDDSIGRITPAGAVTTFTAPGVHTPLGIAAGPDGALWFTDAPGGAAHDGVGRITTAGVITTYDVGPSASAYAITSGPDGAMWFVNRWSSTIGRITMSGAASTLVSPQYPQSIVTGDGEVWFTSDATTIGRMQVVGAPSAPQGVVATAGKNQAKVTWTPPATDGGSPITGYTVTPTSGGGSCTWSSGPFECVVAGLSDTVGYQFSVTATSASGPGAAGLSFNYAFPWSGSAFRATPPTRLLDSRGALGGWNGRLAASNPRDLQVGGFSGIPATAAAVVLNVTATGSSVGSFLQVWPSDRPPGTASSLNFAAGETIANLVTVKLAADGTVRFATALGSTDVVADVVGYYDDGVAPSGGLFLGSSPVRLLDSRTTTGGWDGPLAAGTVRDLAIPGQTGPTTDDSALALTITVTNATAGSFLTVWPSGSPRPSASTINFGPGQTIANTTILTLGAGGRISFATAVGATDVVVDVIGSYQPRIGGRFHPIDPTRILDDRVDIGLSGPFSAGTVRNLRMPASDVIPPQATGLVANLTATNGTTGSFLLAFPPYSAQPSSGSNLNFGPGQTIANQIMVPMAPAAQSPNTGLNLVNKLGTVDVIADATGYFAST